MPPTSIVEQLAVHTAEIANLKEGQQTLSAELRGLKNWIMATLAAALIGVIVQLIRVALNSR